MLNLTVLFFALRSFSPDSFRFLFSILNPPPSKREKKKRMKFETSPSMQWKIIHILGKSCLKVQLISFQSDFWLKKPLPTAYYPKRQTLRGSNCNLAALSKATRTFSWQIEDSMYCTHRASREPISSCRDKNRKEKFYELQSCIVASNEFSSNFTTCFFFCVTGNQAWQLSTRFLSSYENCTILAVHNVMLPSELVGRHPWWGWYLEILDNLVKPMKIDIKMTTTQQQQFCLHPPLANWAINLEKKLTGKSTSYPY